MHDGLHSLGEEMVVGDEGTGNKEREEKEIESQQASSACLASENATHRIKCYLLSLVLPQTRTTTKIILWAVCGLDSLPCSSPPSGVVSAPDPVQICGSAHQKWVRRGKINLCSRGFFVLNRDQSFPVRPSRGTVTEEWTRCPRRRVVWPPHRPL